MKVFYRSIFIGAFLIYLLGGCSAADEQLVTTPQDSIAVLMQRVVEWQEANPNYINDGKYGWGTATYYIGLMSAYSATSEIAYLDLCKHWAAGNDWKLKSDSRDADDHAAGQVFLEIYQTDPQPKYIANVRSVLDSLLSHPVDGRNDWFWLDALFMSPPVLGMLGQITEEPAYHMTLHSMWWDVVDYLLNTDDVLFYRDRNFFDRKNQNGNPIYWSRGNGWALAGLVRVHRTLNASDPRRSDYEDLLKSISSSLVSTQNEYGLWYPNIVDPLSYPLKETSGSSLILYALSYGYNNGILGEEYKAPIINAWNGISNLIGHDGRLSWVQASAGGPTVVLEDDTYMYGTGAFLLAASEMIKMDD
ncbi:MAG: glycoside hydrolase family 88 protein [Bacteroidota bacterium]